MVKVARPNLSKRGLLTASGGEEGQGMSEYVVVLSLLVLAIGAVSLAVLGTTLGASLSDAITRVADAMNLAS
jgi:hypothetical protein